MKTTLFFVFLAISLMFFSGCEKSKKSPFEGNWNFNFFRCYDYLVTIDGNGIFEFTGKLLIYPVGVCDYIVKGNVTEDSDVTGTVEYNNQIVGTFTGDNMGMGDTLLVGSYDIEYNGYYSCASTTISHWKADKLQ